MRIHRKPIPVSENYGSQNYFYEQFYSEVLFGGSLAAKAVRRTHTAMENPYKNYYFPKVLEVGGGKGEHIIFVKHQFDEYICSDLVLNKSEMPINNKISFVQANAESLPFLNNEFDRIIATCLLHHVEKPESVYSEIDRVLKPGGVATIFLSCDPGILVRMLRSITTARSAAKLGFRGFKLLNAREHRNHVMSLLEMARYHFKEKELTVRYYPLRPVKSWNLNGYVILTVNKF